MIRYCRFTSSRSRSNGQIALRTIAVLAGVALGISAAITSIGCDSGSTFLPPPPDGLHTAEAEATPDLPVPPGLDADSVGARSIEMVLDRRDANETEVVAAAARMQAGIDKVKLRYKILSETESPAHQLDFVREAVARRPLTLIVEPADPTDAALVETLEKARADGIPVVLMNRPLRSSGSGAESGKAGGSVANSSAAASRGSIPGAQSASKPDGQKRPFILVAPPSFTDASRQLVASAIRNAKNAQLDPKGGAILLINTAGDAFIPERSAAVRKALADNGITTVEELRFSKSTSAAAKLLNEKLKANPKLVLVFAIDGQATSACRQVMSELIPDRLYVQAGFPADAVYGDLVRVADFAAVAGFIPNRVVRKAIATAISLAQGREVPSRVEVSVEVHDSDEKSTTPQSPVYYKAQTKKAL
jgi:ABC-type sugar transport system substrate-binding protein